jgi:DNA repair exonuclease SbcCD ATPase subunit
MIRFKWIRYKNFLSTGNQFTHIELDKNNTTLIYGTNGSGKSTMLDALTFVLFNKPYRKINKPQLVNSQNEKDCLVETEFEIGKTIWKVRRGIKPAIFEIYRNNNILNQQSDIKDDQKYLEENILKLNYKSFTQLVILGSSNFVPFMQLTAANRREIIEDLLDIKIFSSMNVIVKDKLKLFSDELKNIENKKLITEEKIRLQKEFIQNIETSGREQIQNKKDKLKDIKVHIDKCNQTIEELTNKLKDLQENSINSTSNEIKSLNLQKGNLISQLTSFKKEIAFFESHHSCPTCGQDIDLKFRDDKIKSLQSTAKETFLTSKKVDEMIAEAEEVETQYKHYQKNIDNLIKDIEKVSSEVKFNQQKGNEILKEIQDLIQQIENKSELHQKVKELEDEAHQVANEIDEKQSKLKYYELLNSLLKDGGVKTKIIKKYLPLMNKQINKYLQLMDFYINFNLDEEFNEIIQTPVHDKFSYASFSEGEKMRIDLSLLFTWREIAKMKNSMNTNLLIMDEVFDSSLDGFGTDDFLKIIRYVVKDANIFIISHKSELMDKFENTIKFEKVKGFSRPS